MQQAAPRVVVVGIEAQGLEEMLVGEPLIAAQAWLQAGVLIGVVALFLWGVLEPRFRRAPPIQSESADSAVRTSAQ